MNHDVDEFLRNEGRWQAEFKKLRQVILECHLTEELKWGQPCYTLDGKNVVLMHGFKEYCAVLFIKGALLRDEKGLLIQQTENVQAGRQIRFTHVEEIDKMAETLKAYILEATEVERSGLKVEMKKTSDFAVPAELQARFDEHPALCSAFKSLSPGRQRAYVFHFSQPKQSKTRESRVDKYIPKILAGLGLDD
ncbi:MAG: hypothetical protein CVV51_03475 [Spirochaetae bacterium HGW-Spirochaetae-7]|jgi:uncharacterized protein YdeI (YjbR/CyaY-like superfamily)|nr:MAG: hypothetical protein CVV51_03475 [Spirochaetae bacterium HGW-Spirochaetae-7]